MRKMWTDDLLDPWTEEEEHLSRWRGIAYKKGGGGGHTTSTVTQSNLPEYAEPYYLNLMGHAEAVASEPYQAYGGERIAQFSPDTLGAHSGVRDVVGYGDPYGMAAQSGAYQATNRALGASYDPNQMYNTYTPGAFYAPEIQADQVATDRFSSEAAEYYMSPYAENVSDRLKRRAIEDDQRQQIYRDTEAVNASAYGGSRQAVRDYLAEEGMLNRLADIDATQAQAAYENAQMQFERDRQAYLQAGMSNQDASLRAYLANQGAYMTAQQAAEQSRQFGSNLDYQTQLANEQNRLASAGLDIDAAQAAAGAAATTGQLGTQYQSDWLARLQALAGVGSEQQRMDQLALDQGYTDFINQRDYPRQTINWLSSILHGVPVSPQSNVITYQPGPNPYSQLMGLGLGAAGIYNMMGGQS